MPKVTTEACASRSQEFLRAIQALPSHKDLLSGDHSCPLCMFPCTFEGAPGQATVIGGCSSQEL